jgi:hypothetical protein
MRTDPTDTGGLFVGRRPGTRPVRYRRVPADAGARRRRLDAALAALMLLAMGLVCASFWGPLPAGWLWIGSHVQYWTGSVSVGILSAFVGLLACLLLALVIGKQLDRAWILVRRAAGHDQREGALGRVFAVTCGLGAVVFCAWLLLFSGARLTGGVGG